jgi:colanic acid/amylovoran biosynthesis glycosyltransferase
LKIGLVLSNTPQYSETFFVSKIKGLQKEGHEVVLFAQNKASGFSLCKVILAPKINKTNTFIKSLVILVVVFKLMLYPKRILKFIKLERLVKRPWPQLFKNVVNNSHVLTKNLDWLHFGFATLAIQSEHVAKVVNAKMAVSLRGFDIDVYPLQHPNCYNLIWKNVDKVHSISHYLLEKAKVLGLPEQTDCSIIRPAVDISKIKIAPKVLSEVINLLTVGRLHWIKGLIYTLEALAILKAQGVSFNYTIIGSGPDYESIVFAISQLSLTQEVRLLGQNTHENTLSYYANADIYIQYSASEGFCNAVLEAQAMECLCVVSDGGALIENVIHNQTGWVVPKRNPKILAKTLQEVILLPEDEKEFIKRNAKNRVSKTFSLEKQQKEFLKFYETVAN